MPALSPLLREVIQVRLVLDANIVQGELRWRLRKRRDPTARSGLQEAIDAGVVIGFVPTFLKTEIEEHILRIAAETGTSETQVRGEWDAFQGILHFYEPRPLPPIGPDCVDPDDIAYKKACEELGAVAVYSRDTDFRSMKVPVISVEIDLTLRKYARASSIKMGVTIGSSATIIMGVEAIRELYRAMRSLVAGFRRLPGFLQLAIAAGVLVFLAHPRTREKIGHLWQSICLAADKAKPALLAVLGSFGSQFCAAALAARQSSEEIQSLLPTTSVKRSALTYARAICLIGREPLSLVEIERRMREDGYSSRSKNFRSYLGRVLRESKQFVKISPGLWTLRPTT
jgi:hypothetical protein